MNNLHSFLHAHRTDKQATHVSMIFPKGKFLLKNEEMKIFWEYYNNYDQSKGIAELTNSDILPILVDVDLKKEVEIKDQFLENRVLYNIDHVKTIIGIYQKILEEIIQDVKKEHLICYLLEKKAYFTKSRDKTFIKNGFHLHFPMIFIDKIDHENQLLPRIKLEIKKLNNSDLPNIQNIDNFIDKNYIKNPWLLYGSNKENNDPYLVSCAFDEKNRLIEDWQNTLENYQIYNDLEEKIKIDVVNIDKFLPQIFSILNQNRKDYIYKLKDNLSPVIITNNKINDKIKKINYCDYNENISKLVDNLLSCISDERADDRNEWMQIGWILFNIFDGDQEGYEKWLEFSKRSDKFQETVCFYEWNKMMKKDLTLGSLKYIAKEDNPNSYQKFMSEFTLPLYDKCLKLDGTHNDLANVLFQKHEAEFVCASVTHKLWFQFKNHIWQKIDEGYALRRKISSELVNDYEMIAKDLVTKIRVSESDEETSMEKKRLNAAIKLIRNLKSAPYKSNIMKEATEVFYIDHFLSKLDTNPYLIAFRNGIYDIQNHIFREGRPNDYISLKMTISFNDKYTEKCKEILELHQFFEKIFPDRDVREYFLDSVADVFIGGNFHKIVQIWTGEGDNGKSITQMIFEQMLGPYNIKLPTSLITGKRTQSSAACPELVRAGNGVRLAMLQEPDKKDILNIGILKELSGNDTFFARGLYKEGQEITPMFKLILICNEPPKLTHSDKATWNRIKLIPFESTFTNEAPDSYEEQLRLKKFPKDEQFKDKIPKMLEPLAWFLLHRLKTKPKMKREPLKVTLATANYKKKNDIFKQFMDEWIEEREGKICNSYEMYSSFKEWHKESCPNHPCPDKNEFMDYFIRLWGQPGSRSEWKNKFLRGPIDLS